MAAQWPLSSTPSSWGHPRPPLAAGVYSQSLRLNPTLVDNNGSSLGMGTRGWPGRSFATSWEKRHQTRRCRTRRRQTAFRLQDRGAGAGPRSRRRRAGGAPCRGFAPSQAASRVAGPPETASAPRDNTTRSRPIPVGKSFKLFMDHRTDVIREILENRATSSGPLSTHENDAWPMMTVVGPQRDRRRCKATSSANPARGSSRP